MIFQPIASSGKTIISKTVTENGIYDPSDDSADAYSKLYVGVKTGVLTPIAFDMTYGYVSAGKFTPENLDVCRLDVYEVEAGHTYLIMCGDVIGTRFRVMFSTESTVGATHQISGINIVNKNDPPLYDYKIYNISDNGYLTFQKDNASTDGIISYVVDLRYLVRDCKASPV